MKNLGLIGLCVVAVVLGIALIMLPSQPSQLQPASSKSLEPSKAAPVNSVDEQNYKFLNAKIVSLTKQLNALKNQASNGDEKGVVAELYAKLEKLSHDNQALKDLNDELKKQANNAQKLANKDAKGSYEEAISKLSDELATYKSDNDALKLSLSEKEGVIKSLNSLISTLSNQKQMDEYEHDSAARRLKVELDELRLKLQAGQKNNSDLTHENEVLKQRVENLSKLEVINQTITSEQNKLNMQLVELQKELKAEKKINEDMRQSVKSNGAKLSLENKNLKAKIDEANAEILKLAGQKEDALKQLEQKKNAEAEVEKIKGEMQKLKLQHEKQQSANVQELSKLSSQSQAALDKLNAELSKQSDENAAMSKKLSSAQDEQASLKLKIKELDAELASAKSKLEAAQQQLDENKGERTQLQNLSKDYKDQLALLKKDKIALTSQINALNKEFLSYKNNNYDRSAKDQAALKDKLLKLTLSYDELNAKSQALKDELANAQLDNKALLEKTASLKDEINRLKSDKRPREADVKKIADLEAANEKLLRDLEAANDKQLGKFNAQNSELAALKKDLEVAKKRLVDASKNSSFANIKEVAIYRCDDLPVGTSSLSEKCKLGLRDFLARFDSGYFFEITPILNTGGFRSLSRLTASQMEPAEVKRLTRLANYGLSKDRNDEARNFVRSVITGAFVAISATSEESTDKKGFVLKVYK